MDSLTQIVLGAAVGEAVLGKRVGNRAMLWGAVAGTIPDLDVYTRLFTDPITSMEMHRGVSHSLLFSIAVAPVLAYCVKRRPKWLLIAFLGILTIYPVARTGSAAIGAVLTGVFLLTIWLILRKKQRELTATQWDWTKLFFWCLVTHPLLDAHTTWGTQFFWPFNWRLAHNNIFVVDPLYTVPFLVCLLIAMFMRRENPKRSTVNNTGLIISTTYMALTLLLKWVGYTTFKKSLEKQGIDYVEMDTKPTPLNTILWNAHVETDSGYRVGYYSLFDKNKDIEFSGEFPKNHHLLDPVRNTKEVQQLIHIAAGWYTVEKMEDTLYFTDLRFGQLGVDPNHSPFVWQYKLLQNEDGSMNVERVQPNVSGGIGTALSALAKRINGE